jgi:hypothetical protein
VLLRVQTGLFFEFFLCILVGFALICATLSNPLFYSVVGGSIRVLTRAVTTERLPSLEDGITVATGVMVFLLLRDKLFDGSLKWALTSLDLL